MIKKSTVLWLSGLIGFLLIHAPGVQADLTQKIMGEWKGNGTQYSGESWTIQILVQPSGSVAGYCAMFPFVILRPVKPSMAAISSDPALVM